MLDECTAVALKSHGFLVCKLKKNTLGPKRMCGEHAESTGSDARFKGKKRIQFTFHRLRSLDSTSLGQAGPQCH